MNAEFIYSAIWQGEELQADEKRAYALNTCTNDAEYINNIDTTTDINGRFVSLNIRN